MMPIFARRLTGTLPGLLLLVGLLGWTPRLAAQGNGNGTTQSCSPSPNTGSLPAFSALFAAQSAYGSIGSPTQTSITFFCGNNVFAGQVTEVAIWASTTANAIDDPTYGLLIPTGLANVWVQLQALSPAYPLTAGTHPLISVNKGSQTVTVTFRAQLVLRGPIGSGGSFSGPIALISHFYNADTVSPGGSAYYGSLGLGGGTTNVTSVSCTTKGPTVVLPTVSLNALASNGATAGSTPFELDVTGCPAGLAVAISLSGTPASSGGAPIAASSGIVQSLGTDPNVAVQVLDGVTLAPVDIGGTQAKSMGTAQTGVPLISRYYARYYAVSPAAGGTVAASLTYTLTYP